MFDWDDIDEAIENDYEHAPYYVDPVWRNDGMTLGAKTIESVCELCAAEGYPYNEKTCKDCTDNPHKRSDDMPRDYSSITWNGSITETTTFEYRTTSRGTVDEYKCSYCGCYIYFPAYDTYASEKIDYDYCPYCGKPVVESEE